MPSPTLALIADAKALHTARVARGIRDLGYDITILSPAGVDQVDGIPVIPVTTYRDPGAKAPSALATAAEYRAFRRTLRQFELVHVLGLTNSRRWTMLTGLPRLVITPLGSDVLARPDNPITPPRRQWCRLALHAAQGVLPTSRYVATEIAHDYQLATDRLHPILWGPDTTAFDPARFPTPPEEPFTIGFFKHLRPYYGPAILLDALATFLPRFPGPWRCLIYGSGPLEEELRATVARLQLADHVAFGGQLPLDWVPTVMARCHVVVSPSVVPEALGMASLEAQALGIPVINTELGGMPETCLHGESGFLVPVASPAVLAGALLTLATDPERRQLMGARGRAFIHDSHLTWADTLAQTDRIYRLLLAHPRQCVPPAP